MVVWNQIASQLNSDTVQLGLKKKQFCPPLDGSLHIYVMYVLSSMPSLKGCQALCAFGLPRKSIFFIIVVKSLVFQSRLYVCRRFLAQSSIIEYHLPHLLSECRYLEFIWKTGKFHLYNCCLKESRISYLKKFTNVD